jgi:hypothetical protein
VLLHPALNANQVALLAIAPRRRLPIDQVTVDAMGAKFTCLVHFKMPLRFCSAAINRAAMSTGQ